ncbi:MAG: hypothetical protein MUE53_06285 [Chitinophagales bacterium]|jgi:hypothetical protein|nr:hypothetical protein [Chitinophagales bacterium]
MKKTKRNKGFKGLNLEQIFMLICGLALMLTLYFLYRADKSGLSLFSFPLLTLFAGIVFESYRITQKWKTVGFIFITAYLVSFLAFLPVKGETSYKIENHIALWPIGIVIFYTTFFWLYSRDIIQKKIHEGTTLLLSLSMIYWLIEHQVFRYQNWLAYALDLIILIFVLLSLVHAFTYLPLTQKNRFWLSMWSRLILVRFALDHIIRVFNQPEIALMTFSEAFSIALQYFLLGISVVYIIRNMVFFTGFLAGKNETYQEGFLNNIQKHIANYSEEQVPISHSLLCVVYAGSLFALNYLYPLLPYYTMIWWVIITFPLFLSLIEAILLTDQNKTLT